MVRHDPSLSLTGMRFISGDMSRRDFMKRAAALGLTGRRRSAAFGSQVDTAAAIAAAYTPERIAERAAAQVAEVPREQTLVAVRGGSQGKFIEYQLWNPSFPLANHQLGSQMTTSRWPSTAPSPTRRPCGWPRATSTSADYKKLTIKTRPNINWSDGEPFSAEDVAYTFNKLVEVGAAVKWGADVQQFLDTAEATDDNTVVCQLQGAGAALLRLHAPTNSTSASTSCRSTSSRARTSPPSPLRHREGLAGDDRPLAGRLRLATSRRCSTAPTTGGASRPASAKLPAPKRFVYLPDPGEQELVAGIISNQYDFTTGIQPATFPTVFAGNPKVTTWTGTDSPFGNVDWWPHSLYVNNEVAPWSDQNVRWAISYYIDRAADHRGRLDRREPPVDALRARLSAA